ncbi:hypothetical protein [Brevundimonas sp.]|uniref:hypothetical protein n=1 Tax=Brevundimonas sp. TaxID=1871086 RepID=UPI003BAAA7B7
MNGNSVPQAASSFASLARLEPLLSLRPGYLTSRARRVNHLDLGMPRIDAKRPMGLSIPRWLIDWHIPADFSARTSSEQQEIGRWLTETFATDPHKIAMRHQRFNGFDLRRHTVWEHGRETTARPPTPRQLRLWSRPSPPCLIEEWRDLSGFKTARFNPPGLRRTAAWSRETASAHGAKLGCLFAAAIDHHGEVVGKAKAAPVLLSFAMLAVPRVWDIAIGSADSRKGHLSRGDTLFLALGRTLLDPRSGWLPQAPHLAGRLRRMAGVVSDDDVTAAQQDWPAFCARAHDHLSMRVADVARLSVRVRDPLRPIAPILDAPNPLFMIGAIAEYMWSQSPDPQTAPLDWARHVRDYLLLRIGMHTALRSRNIRELRIGQIGLPNSGAGLLGTRGELRRERSGGWEVIVPRAAFKNSRGAQFGSEPFRVALPDWDHLHERIAIYLEKARPLLSRFGSAEDAVFVSVQRKESRPMTHSELQRAWWVAMAQYGILNPWTGRGLVDGLLPHGPHTIRSIVATQILKTTGSIHLAAFAIQDHPVTVQKYYIRYLPAGQRALVDDALARARTSHLALSGRTSAKSDIPRKSGRG